MARLAVILALILGPWLGMSGRPVEAQVPTFAQTVSSESAGCTACCHRDVPNPGQHHNPASHDSSSCYLKICCLPFVLIDSIPPQVAGDIDPPTFTATNDSCPQSVHALPAVPPPRSLSVC